MTTDAAAPRKHRPWLAPLRRHLLTCCITMACLLALLPAAHAHDDDEMPTPDRVFWGAFFFILILTWTIVICHYISRQGSKRRIPARDKRRLMSPFLRWLTWSPPEKPPRNASRQVRRAFLRRRG